MAESMFAELKKKPRDWLTWFDKYQGFEKELKEARKELTVASKSCKWLRGLLDDREVELRISREAVGELNKLLEWARPFVKDGYTQARNKRILWTSEVNNASELLGRIDSQLSLHAKEEE